MTSVILFLSTARTSSLKFTFNRRASFPLREFYNTTDDKFLKEQENHLCDGYSARGCCSCSDECIRFKSCCANYLWDKKGYTDVRRTRNY